MKNSKPNQGAKDCNPMTRSVRTISSLQVNKQPHLEFLGLCEQYNFIGYSFERIGKKEINGVWKKDPINQPSRKGDKITRATFKNYIKPSHKAFAIITGAASGVTVIDCDTPDAYEKLLCDFPELKDTLTAKTRKGWHIFCQFVPSAISNSMSFQSYPDVDIRNNGGVVFAQPTVYDWFGEQIAYTFTNIGAKILQMPSALIEDLKDSSKRDQSTAKRKTQKVVIPNCQDYGAWNEELASKIRELENQLPLDVRDSRISWIKLGAIIHHELGNNTKAKQLFLDLSRRSPNYSGTIPGKPAVSMVDVDHIWKDFGKSNSRPATIASLHYAVDEIHRPRLKGFAFLDDVEDMFQLVRNESDDKDEHGNNDHSKNDDGNGNSDERCADSHDNHADTDDHDTSHDKHDADNTDNADDEDDEDDSDANDEHVNRTEIECECKHEKSSINKQHDNAQIKQKSHDNRFNFDRNINQTTLAKFFVKCYGSDFVRTFKLDGSDLSLFHWNAATTVWETSIKAKLFIMRQLSDEFFDMLHLQAKTLKDSHRAAVYKALPKLLQSHSSKESIYQEILTYLPLTETVIFDTGRAQYDNVHFRNGVLMLDQVHFNQTVCCNRAFRERVKEDYVTETLDWDFGPVNEAALNRVQEMFRQIQPGSEQSRFQLDWLAYCLTGHTGAHRFKMNIGYTAENGKSTEAKIHRKVFSLYSSKLPKNLFSANNEKRHKFLIELLEKPIRFAYLEELDRAKLDEDLLKDWVDGEEQTVEVMYGTKLRRLSQAKFTTSSNKDPNANADKGLLRRGMLAHYTSKFVSDPGDNPPPNVFKKTGELDVLFLQQDYRRAYLWMLLPHVVRYYREGLVVPLFAVLQFKDVMDQYDAFQTALYEVCEQTTEEHRVWKDDLVEALKPKLGQAIKWEKHVLPEIKRLGLHYIPTVRVERRHPDHTSDNPRGAILGLKWLS